MTSSDRFQPYFQPARLFKFGSLIFHSKALCKHSDWLTPELATQPQNSHESGFSLQPFAKSFHYLELLCSGYEVAFVAKLEWFHRLNT